MKRAVIKDLNALSHLKDQLKLRAEQEKIAEQQRLVEERETQKQANLFRSNVGAITPIKTSATFIHPRQAVPALPQKKTPKEFNSMAEAMADPEQWSDEFDPHLLEEAEGASYAVQGSSPEVLAKLRKGQWPVQAFLDLHGMQRDQARSALADFLNRSTLARLRSVCVIHGKGMSSRQPAVLPGKVRSWLSQSELVQAYCPAAAQDGGAGAVHVLLQITP